MFKKNYIINSLMIITVISIFFINSCTVQVVPQDSTNQKKSETKSFSFDYSSKKSKKKAKAEVVQPKEPETKQPETKQPTADAVVKAGDIVWACYFGCNTFSGAQWGKAKLVTLASDATRGEYEVEFLYNTHATAPGSRMWTKHVILKHHKPKIEELKPGMVVLSGAANYSYLTVVKEVLAYKNAVVLERIIDDKVWTETREGEYFNAVTMIDEPVIKDPRIK